MLRIVLTAAILALLWLLMSGLYSPLILSFGALSVLLVLFITGRMDRIDGVPAHLPLHPVKYPLYLIWLMVEIAKANWAVTRIVLSRRMQMRQHLFFTGVSQKTDLGQVVFANSITLTPGTITVETEPGRFLVHALNYSAADDAALADMDRRISATELAPADNEGVG